MSKKLLAIFLAAAMAVTLLAGTAFAAEPGSITTNLTDEAEDSLRIPDATFTLRGWDAEEGDGDWWYILTRGETEDFTPEYCYELPLGITLTINAGEEYKDFSIYTIISLYAWSDPDGDGVYDAWISDWDGIIPPTEEGPIEVDAFTSRFGLYSESFQDAWESDDREEAEWDVSDVEIFSSPDGIWGIPSTVQVTSDTLTEYFGANTLVEVSVLTNEDEDVYTNYYFLLTGEQADPSLPKRGEEAETPAQPETPDGLIPETSVTTYEQGSGEGVTLHCTEDLSLFTGLLVDGNEVDPEYYTLEEGSTIVKLNPDYLDTLDAGEHTVEVLFSSGNVKVAITVAESGTVNPPATGDNSLMALWVVLALASLAGMAVTVLYSRKARA